MSATTNQNNGCECTGAGAPVLAHTRLQFIQKTDPLLGSSSPDIPEGVFNRELAKLQENFCVFSSHFVKYLGRTTAVVSSTAPAVGDPVGTPSGAPSTPTEYSYHAVKYTDFLVVYWYNIGLGQWSELSRSPVIGTSVARHIKTLEMNPTNGASAVAFAMPTDDDEGANAVWTWTVNDIKTMYLRQNGTGAVVGLRNSLAISGNQITVQLDGPALVGSDYTLVVVFEKLIIS